MAEAGSRPSQSSRKCPPHVPVRAGANPLGNRRGLLIARGTLGYGSITCFFLACQLLPLADATTFTFLAPLLVALFSPCVLQEHPGLAVAVVLPVCITGVLLIAQPSFLFGGGGEPAAPGAPARLRALGLTVGLLQPFFSASAKVRFWTFWPAAALHLGLCKGVVLAVLACCSFSYRPLQRCGPCHFGLLQPFFSASAKVRFWPCLRRSASAQVFDLGVFSPSAGARAAVWPAAA